MTQPKHPDDPVAEPEPRKRATKRGGLFVTDAELIERVGVPEKIGYEALRMLDRTPEQRFPPKDPLWGGRRYWPAVKAWLDAYAQRKIAASTNRRSAA